MVPATDPSLPSDRKEIVRRIRSDALREAENSRRQSWLGKWANFVVGLIGLVIGATAAGIVSGYPGWAAGLAAAAGGVAALQSFFRPGEQRVWHAHRAAAFQAVARRAEVLLVADSQPTEDEVRALAEELKEQIQTKLD